MSSKKIASYSYLSWLRQGLVNQIAEKPTKEMRASMKVEVTIGTDNNDKVDLSERQITKDIQLYGPGDINGIQPEAVIRTEPGNNITNFEPNYLAFIEFYDEDFPWRYTPIKPVGNKLEPWISLIVLKDDEFSDSALIPQIDSPLPFINIKTSDPLPFPELQWAWAHVHMNADLSDEGGRNQKIETVLNKNPDSGYSRLVSPRRLEPNTPYHAFVIPTYEVGRQIGLGKNLKEPKGKPHSSYAWKKEKSKTFHLDLPYYYRWYFRTGQKGDFEYLVKLLRQRTLDSRVGIRPMAIPPLNGKTITTPKGILGLEGALLAPTTERTPWPKGEGQQDAYQKKLTTQINLGGVYKTKRSGAMAGKDPIISPPLYGRWHANTEQLSPPNDNWFHTLNLDPRFRAAAGLGSEIIRKNQEPLMAEAWKQVGEVLEANRILRMAQLALLVSQGLYKKHLLPRPDMKIINLCAPLHKKILPPREKITVFEKIRTSGFPNTVMAPVFRRLIRPRTKFKIHISSESKQYGLDNLLQHIQTDISVLNAARPLKPSPGKNGIQAVIREMNKYPDLKVANWVQDSGDKPLYQIIQKEQFIEKLSQVRDTWKISEIQMVLPTIDLSSSMKGKLKYIDPPGFSLKKPPELVEVILPKNAGNAGIKPDRYLQAMQDQWKMMEATHVGLPAPKKTLDVKGLAAKLSSNLDPRETIGKRVLKKFQLEGSGFKVTQKVLPQIMAYPEFPQAMYEPLAKLSAEYFVPNIDLIPSNTISLLETNPKFVEAFLIGLNHEMARELLWREYPTDQRGSYFRQFWEVMALIKGDTAIEKKELAEQRKDILPIHKWKLSSKLGSHVLRGSNSDLAKKVVLVIRGDLLTRYPNTDIYAHRAEWVRAEISTQFDKKHSRRFVKDAKPLRPTFRADIKPDITFLGFDLTIEQAKGEEGDPGWFFVLKERSGEPRIGLDETSKNSLPIPTSRKNITWEHVKVEAGRVIHLNEDPLTISKVAKAKINEEIDTRLVWGNASSSAQLACILTQDPMLVGVHAEVMLSEEKTKVRKGK